MAEEDRLERFETLLRGMFESLDSRIENLQRENENTRAMMHVQALGQNAGIQSNSNMMPGFGQEQPNNLDQPPMDTGANRGNYESLSPGPPNLIPIPTGDAPAPTGIGGNSSRSTFLVAQTGAQPTGSATHGVAQMASAMVIHTQERVSPAEQVQYLTWPGLRQVMDIMTSPVALDTFAPTKWTGLKVPEVDFETTPGMPASLPVKSRPIRQELYAHARKEFDRLVQYFYEHTSGSPIASPLVILM